MERSGLDPNKRYLSCTVVKGNAFVDFVNVRPDEDISISVSFLKNRYTTRMVQCSTDPVFDETFLFEFVGDVIRRRKRGEASLILITARNDVKDDMNNEYDACRDGEESIEGLKIFGPEETLRFPKNS